MKLDDFANNFLGSSGQYSNSWDSKKIDNLTHEMGGFENANPFLVTTAWQTLLESPDLAKKLYPQALESISSYPSMENHLEKYLLCLGNNNYCLLIFDPTLTSDEPVRIDASLNNSKKSIDSGFSIWRSKMNSSIATSKSMDRSYRSMDVPKGMTGFGESMYSEKKLNTINPQLLHYGINNSEWPIVVSKPPKKIYTCQHPNEPHKVILKDGENFKSLAGVYTSNFNGDFGVTVCLHGFPNSYVEAGKTKVNINGVPGTVVSVHNISDSCFVKLDMPEQEIKNLLKANGPLQGTTPREFEKCYFINKEAERTDTNVIGWSPDILYFDPYNQVKVLTNPVTNPGDSGSALVDLNDNVLGFSFYRTEIGAVKEFSAWIWAASVFKAHNLIF